MKKCRLHQVDAFTTDLFQGNPAGVVPDADGLTAAQMQAIAREMNNSETAFILSPTAADHEVWIRFFTPTTEVPSCGHATIAAHYVRTMEMGLPSCRVIQKIGAGILPVEIIRKEEDYSIVMTQGAIEFGESFTGQKRDEIVAALGLGKGDLDARCPVQIVSTGHSKVLVGIQERTVLNQLQPDLARLTEISRRIKCNGYFVFTLVNDSGDVLSHVVPHHIAPIPGYRPKDMVSSKNAKQQKGVHYECKENLDARRRLRGRLRGNGALPGTLDGGAYSPRGLS